MNTTSTFNNKAKDKIKISGVTGITIIRVAAFAFAIVSWKATASGLSEYVFGQGWHIVAQLSRQKSKIFIMN